VSCFYPGKIAGVINVPVSEQNHLDVAPLQAELLEHARKLRHLACEPGVDEHRLTARGII